MANEATLVYELSPQVPFTCADANALTKGTVLVLTDPMTASAAAAATSGSVIAGIAGSDKIALDGITKIGAYRYGIFKMTGSGSITVGDPLVNWGNLVSTAAVNVENILGTALETAANAETLLVEVSPIVMQLA